MTDDSISGDVPIGPSSPDWPTRFEEMTTESPSPRRRELHRLADTARRVLHGLAVTDAETEDIRRAADRLEAVAEVFAGSAVRSIYQGFSESANSGDVHGFFDHSPLLGRANPIAPPITLHPVDNTMLRATVTFGAAYEGPPGCVHGGFIAAAFDEILGSAQSLSGQPGMTANLSIDYRSPTPLHEELTLVGRFESTEGRKVFTSGTLHAGDRLCAEGRGLFIAIDFGTFAALEEARHAQRPANQD